MISTDLYAAPPVVYAFQNDNGVLILSYGATTWRTAHAAVQDENVAAHFSGGMVAGEGLPPVAPVRIHAPKR